MATITQFRWSEMEIDDPRDPREGKIRNKITLKTSDRMTWTQLRLMRPVPQWNDPHPKENGFYLDFIKPTHKTRHVWELEAEYTVFKGGQIDPDPIARPTVITFSASLVEEASLRDAKDFPTVNRAGEFITGLMRQIPIVEYLFTKNFTADPKWITSHLGAVNSDSVRIRGIDWKPKTLLLSSVSGGEFQEENRAKYTAISGTILADYRTWTQEVWNLGTVQLKQVERTFNDPSTPSGIVIKKVWVQVPILSGDPAEPVTEPVPIDEKGIFISDSIEQSTTEPMKKQKLITLKFDMQTSAAFSELPLK